MGVEENDDRPINLLEVQSEISEQEPIEQVFSQESEDAKTLEPSTESEDQERFEETAKFEDIVTPKVEPKLEQKQTRKSKVRRKSPTRGMNEGKPISKLQDELRKHSDARKNAEGNSRYKKRIERSAASSSCNYQRSSKTSFTDAQEDCHD